MNADAPSSILSSWVCGFISCTDSSATWSPHAGLFLSLRAEYDPMNSSHTSLIMEYHMGFSDFSGTITTNFTSTFSPMSNECRCVHAGQLHLMSFVYLLARHHRTWLYVSNPVRLGESPGPNMLSYMPHANRSNEKVSFEHTAHSSLSSEQAGNRSTGCMPVQHGPRPPPLFLQHLLCVRRRSS